MDLDSYPGGPKFGSEESGFGSGSAGSGFGSSTLPLVISDLIHNGSFMFFKCYRYRFDKETVVRLTEQLPNLERPNDRGRPLTPIQQVCITLGYFGGGQLTRIAGLCGGVSQKAAWWAIR